jgi:hypothetical protein
MHCPGCDAVNAPEAVHCQTCGDKLPRSVGDDAAKKRRLASVIPDKNPRALAGYYCGFLALVPVVGIVLAPVAIVLGIMGLRHRLDHPEARGAAHAVIAIVCGALSLACNPVIAALAYFDFAGWNQI